MQLAQLNNKILGIYAHAQSDDIAGLSQAVFSSIKSVINFDSAGYCDFQLTSKADFKITSALSFNISAAEKLRARAEYVGIEKINADGKLESSDPLLCSAYNANGNSKFACVSQLKNNALAAYAKETEANNSLTMVIKDLPKSQVKTLSIWRGREKALFLPHEAAIADILLPHVFQSVAINQRVNQLKHTDTPDMMLAICTFDGVLRFIDELAVNLLQKEFTNWAPPLLPDKILHALQTVSKKTYISKHFTLSASRIDTLRYLKIRRAFTFDQLTPTELVVAEHIAKGLSYKAISQKLGTQPATVRNQVHNVYVKLGISGKAALMQMMACQK